MMRDTSWLGLLAAVSALACGRLPEPDARFQECAGERVA
jgi:hypothetical protein